MRSFNRPLRIAAAVLATAAFAAAAGAAEPAKASTKDIVLDRVRPVPVAAAAAAPAPVGDAMAVSVLLESADGTLTPKSVRTLFHTGDRFRVKLLGSRDARVSLFNTNPKGVTDPKPIWQGELKQGLETISARLRLDGNSGVDQLHIVMEPVQQPSVFVWLTGWLSRVGSKDADAKDIHLDVQNTASATYLLNARGQGLVSTIQIAHGSR